MRLGLRCVNLILLKSNADFQLCCLRVYSRLEDHKIDLTDPKVDIVLETLRDGNRRVKLGILRPLGLENLHDV